MAKNRAENAPVSTTTEITMRTARWRVVAILVSAKDTAGARCCPAFAALRLGAHFLEERPHPADRQADHGVEGALDALDERPGAALDGVRPGFVERLARGHVRA